MQGVSVTQCRSLSPASYLARLGGILLPGVIGAWLNRAVYQETVSNRAAPLRCGSTGTVAASQGSHAVRSTTIFLSVIDHSLSSPAKRVPVPLAPPFPLGAEVLASQACPAERFVTKEG